MADNPLLNTPTATLTSVAASITSVLLLAANTAREGFIFHNDSNSSCYVAFAATASATAFTFLVPSRDSLNMQLSDYSGDISGIWEVANGSMRITELS